VVYRVGGCVAVLGGGRRLAVAGVSCGWVGVLGDRCCWCGCRRLASVGFIGWWLFDAGIELVWVWCEKITLSIQDLICDGGRWVAAEGDPVGGCGGVW
jgi:hypothetical protein